MKFRAISALAVILLLGSAAVWHWWPRLAPAPAPPPAVIAPPAPETEAVPPIANPIPAGESTGTNAPALPALADSDQPLSDALLGQTGAQPLRGLLIPDNLIRHLVATVDNLPRHRLAVELRPLRATPGALLVVGDDMNGTLDDGNSARYAVAAAILRQLDMAALVRLYKSYYPLFQRAYQDLGYPQGYFNDRLVAVIDHLLATPELQGPVKLIRPKVFWEFADPELEARSAGQKFLLRVGAANAALLRARLRELRAQIAAGGPAVTAPR